jgi:hypothetical protein
MISIPFTLRLDPTCFHCVEALERIKQGKSIEVRSVTKEGVHDYFVAVDRTSVFHNHGGQDGKSGEVG